MLALELNGARRTREEAVATRVEERVAARMVGPWWLFLVTGIVWLIVAKIVLDADWGSVAAIAAMTGFMFIAAGVNEFVTAGVVDAWRWLHVILGLVFILTGVFAFIRPEVAFLSLAAIIGWYLLFKGFLDIVVALSNRAFDLWWLGLLVGIAELLIGFWAAGSPRESIELLIIWVGAAALARGIMEIVLAFRLRGVQTA
jgi:uncharacterized membrane protein HdeD (DUF308 family)